MLTAKIRMTFSLAASATYRMTRRHRMFIGDLRCSKPDTPLHPNELVQPGLSTEAILKHRSKWSKPGVETPGYCQAFRRNAQGLLAGNFRSKLRSTFVFSYSASKSRRRKTQ
jgi:hypothetical protein